MNFAAGFRRLPLQVRVDGGTLVLQVPGAERAIRLNSTARKVWEHLEYAAGLDEITGRLGAEFSGAREEIRADVAACIDWLCGKNVVEVCPAPGDAERQRSRYLHVLKRSLVNLLYPEHELRMRYLRESATCKRDANEVDETRFLRDIRYLQPERHEALVEAKQDCIAGLAAGVPFCFPHTLLGLSGMDNMERCAERVFADEIPGDFLEAGVCQGGAAVFLRALQVSFGQAERRLWAVDSFQGLPKPESAPDLAGGIDFSESNAPKLAFSLEEVRDLFLRYDLLDERVVFLQGWFAETLPGAPIGPLALLRVDADMYASTREVLENLYDRVSPGGFVIVDDYGSFPFCRQAVDEFRAERNIGNPLQYADRTVAYWRK